MRKSYSISMAAPIAPLAKSSNAIPDYLLKHYRWFYVSPFAILVFERQWLVNLILLGNYRRLRDAAIEALCLDTSGNVLQVGCVYGDLTERIAESLTNGSQLDVIDPIPVQLSNLRRKLGPSSSAKLHNLDASSMSFPPASFDRVLLFFLLHEQPESVRQSTIEEVFRVLKPSGKLVIVDYSLPKTSTLGRAFLLSIIGSIEPFVTGFLRTCVETYFAADAASIEIERQLYCGDLYQLVRVTLKTRSGT
jgi:ubiquinone/menaquinone biosynthesis C-methylase UbiE